MTDERKEILEKCNSLSIYYGQDKRRNGRGFVMASWGHNLITGCACIFLSKDNKCIIHESKPLECRELLACKDIKINREEVIPYWIKRQNWFSMISKKIEKKRR